MIPPRPAPFTLQNHHSVTFEFIVSAPALYFKMHSSAIIFSILPAVVLAVLPTNITYPRRVLHTASFMRPFPSVGPSEPFILYDYDPVVINGSKAVCTQPIVTVTTTVTSATSCGKDQPSHTNFPLSDCRYDLPRLRACIFQNQPTDWPHVPTTQDLKTASLWTRPSKTATISAKLSKTATVTWWDASTTITGGGPWPVVPTLTNKVFTTINGTSRILKTHHTTTNVWAETYSASTATVHLNTTSISGIFIKPAFHTRTHHADKTKTSTVVDFQTKTKVHAHTTVPDPSETDEESSDSDDEDNYPSENRLPGHPSRPAPISIADGSRTSHFVWKRNSPTQHLTATVYLQEGSFDKDKPEDDEDDEDEDESHESNHKKPSFYNGDDGDDEDEEEDLDKETAFKESHGTTSTSATATSTRPPKVNSTKTADQGKQTSSSTRKPAAKPQPTGVEIRSSTKKHTALTLFASATSALPSKGSLTTKSTSPFGEPTTFPKHPAWSTSHMELQLEDLFTEIPIPSPPYNKTYEAHFPLSSVTLSYKPAHHEHLATGSLSKSTKTDDRLETPSATVTWHPVVVSTIKTSPHMSNEQKNGICEGHCPGGQSKAHCVAMCRYYYFKEDGTQDDVPFDYDEDDDDALMPRSKEHRPLMGVEGHASRDGHHPRRLLT
ncbi:hypothetical protein DPSP01_010985 [Paraphaeosphaeria sporulosa]